ncbi:hypothetical protein ACFW3D_40655 [Streptomyces sp. NPDC058864]
MALELLPPVGVGRLRIGMERRAAADAPASFRDPAALSEPDRPGQHVFRPSGLMIGVDCLGGELQAVELGRPHTPADRVLFRGLDVFALPAREVVRRMREHATIEEDPDEPASFVASDLLLSFWRPFAADDEPGERQGHYFSTVLLARPGYYDTPAQAAERSRTSAGQPPSPPGF